jgi:hypothetical protein
MKPKIIIDECNEVWHWNGERVYMVKAEIEFIQAGENVEQNGYFADTLEQALKEVEENSGLADIQPFVNSTL